MAQETTSTAEIPAAEAGAAAPGHEVVSGTTEAAHGGGEGGLPQLQFEHWGGQILWLLILFAIFYALVAKVFVPRLRGVMDTRQETISGAIAEARKAQAEADEQSVKAQAEIADARNQALRISSEARARAKAESDARLAEQEAGLAKKTEEAEARIRAARDQAMGQVPSIARDTAEAVIAKLSTPATAAELAKATA